MKHKTVRMITEGAMMLALTGVFLLINRATGAVLDAFLAFVMPLPAIFYIAKYGFKQGLVLSVAMALLGLMLASPTSLFYLITAIVVGLAYGTGIHRDKDNLWLILVTTVLTAISFFIEMVILANLFGYDFRLEAGLVVKSLNDAGITGLPANIETLILSIYPVVMGFTALLQSILTHIFAVLLLSRLKIKPRKMKALNELQLPMPLAIVLAAGLFANTLLPLFNTEVAQIILTNITLVSMIAFAAQGYLFVLLISKIIGKPVLSLLAALIFMVLPFVGAGIGLFDRFTDLRKRVLYTYAQPPR
jgi:uncharacterized protein YybS (DUF2232 family)